MLTPEQLRMASEALGPIFEQFEDFVIRDIVRRIVGAGESTPTAGLQAASGGTVGVSLNEIIKALQQALNISDQELVKIFENLGATGLLQMNERLSEAGLNPVKIEELPDLQRIINEAAAQTNGTLHNFANTMGFAIKTPYGTQFMNIAGYFQNTVDLAILKVRAGAADYNSAIRQAIKELAHSGVQIVDYASGYHCGIDVAVRRAVLTGLNQMATQTTLEMNEALETDLVEVSAHEGARPSHALWQGKIYKLHGRTDKYPNLEIATGYGTVTGLKGAYCRHTFYPYVEGMARTWSDEELKYIDPPPFEYNGKRYTYYEATQQQRAYERRIRQIKRELIGYDAAGMEEDFAKTSYRLKQVRDDYKAFSKKAGLRLKNERAQVLQYGRSISRRSVQAAKAYEEELRRKARERAIIEEIKAAGIKGQKFTLNPEVDEEFIKNLGFNEEHINVERQHNVTEEEAKDFIRNAKLKVERMNGDAINFYCENGVAYTRIKENRIRTSFKKAEFSEEIQKVMEVLKKYGL